MAVSIDDLIGMLPQELQDKIFELYISMPAQDAITINKRYKPPPQLHIDRMSRAILSAKLYNESSGIIFDDVNVLASWLKSLTLAAFRSLRLFKFNDPLLSDYSAEHAPYRTRIKIAAFDSHLKIFSVLLYVRPPHDPRKGPYTKDITLHCSVAKIDKETGHKEVVYMDVCELRPFSESWP